MDGIPGETGPDGERVDEYKIDFEAEFFRGCFSVRGDEYDIYCMISCFIYREIGVIMDLEELQADKANLECWGSLGRGVQAASQENR